MAPRKPDIPCRAFKLGAHLCTFGAHSGPDCPHAGGWRRG